MNSIEQITERMGRYVRDGMAQFLADLILSGRLNHLNEFEQRQNMAMTLFRSAEIREHHELLVGFEHPVLNSEARSVEFHMDMMGFARERRQLALEISWNPEGKSLVEQLQKFTQDVTPQSPQLLQDEAPLNA